MFPPKRKEALAEIMFEKSLINNPILSEVAACNNFAIKR